MSSGIESLESRVLLSAGQLDASSRPIDFVRLGNSTYFLADDGVHGQELWRTDGTANGTSLVKDAHPGSGTGAARLWTFGSSLYFSGPDGLWKSNGTANGTVKISSVVPMSNQGARLGDNWWFFSANPTRGLYKTDGTSNGTVLVKSFYDVSILGTAGGTVVYLAAETSDSPYTLWASGGSAGDGTQLRSQQVGRSGFDLAAVSFDDELYFYDISPSAGVNDWLGEGYGLWKTDGTADGTHRISSVKPSAMAIAGDGLIFTSLVDFGAPPSYTLWKSDGTLEGTAPLTDLPDVPRNLVTSGHRAYFTVDSQLWTSDGTVLGTKQVTEIGFNSADHLFAGSDGLVYAFGQSKIWVSDGTEQGTTKLGDIPSGVIVGLLSASPSGPDFYFQARNNDGWEPWTVDSSGVHELINVNTQPPAPPFSIESADQTVNGAVQTSKPSFFIRTDDDPTQIAIFVDGTEVTRQQGSQYFHLSIPVALSNGSHVITAASADVNGVLGAQSRPLTITINAPSNGPSDPPVSSPVGVSSTLVNGELRVVGTSVADSILIFRRKSNPNMLEVADGSIVIGAYKMQQVSAIRIEAGDGSDRIRFDGTNGAITTTSRIYGGGGDDVIFGGDGTDRVYGGDGNDWITGNSGNDILYGEAGNDRMFGGDGKDYLDGGAGNTVLRGEGGVDRIVATKSKDDFRGNAGDVITLVL